MVLKCIVANCSYESGKDDQIQVHSFPTESPKILKKWTANMKLPQSLQLDSVKDTAGICSQHFLKKCFLSSDGSHTELKDNAVPTLLQSDDGKKAWKKIAPDAEALPDLEEEMETDEQEAESSGQRSTRGRGRPTKSKINSDHDHPYQAESSSPPRSTRSKRTRTPKIKFDPSVIRKSPKTVEPSPPPKSTTKSTLPGLSPPKKTTINKKKSVVSEKLPAVEVIEEEEIGEEEVAEENPEDAPIVEEVNEEQSQETEALRKEVFELSKKVNYQKAQIHRLESRLLHREGKVEDLQYAVEKLKSIIMCCECGMRPENLEEFAKSLKRKRIDNEEEASGGKEKAPKVPKQIPNKPTQVICRNDLVVSLTWKELFSRVNSLAEDFESD